MKKQEMVKVVKDPKITDLLSNPNMHRILNIMRQGELNVKEIHTLFNKDYEDKKTLTSIYRYMDTLLENDLVFVSREELKRGHLMERNYSRTAMFFLFEETSDEDLIDATSRLFQKIYHIDDKNAEELKALIQESEKSMTEQSHGFYEVHGKEVLDLEKAHGFKAARAATKILVEFIFFIENPEMIKKIREIVKKSSD
ncbi:MAG: hypothetical protein HXS52_06475 [Theionarchaea archaeon]|nr:hypothetical protein [Theionarchaea archaeon]MBU7037558.1 hypothetical protein [Theionarchaea archaeon]